MSGVVLSAKGLSAGCKVRLAAQDGDFRYECTAIVESVNLNASDPIIKAKGCREIKSGVLEPGLQAFTQSELVMLEVLEKPDAAKAEAEATTAPSRRRAKGSVSVSKPPRGNDNPHLKKLHSLRMDEILAQTQIAPPPSMESAGENLVGHPRIIPAFEQCLEHQEGETFTQRLSPEFEQVRRVFWEDRDTPPPVRFYPEKLYVIDGLGSEAYEDAMAHLEEQNIIGLSLEGQLIGRKGELSLLCVSTRQRVILFDAVAIGADDLLYEGGELRDLLESPVTMKVMHDCRQASDMLANRFGVRLNNVYDTLAAHALFLTWSHYAGYLPKFAYSISYMARAYLGIKGKDLFFPHYRQDNLAEDTAIWLQRPLPDNLEIGAVRCVAYLLDLQRATRECMNSPFIKATECLLEAVRDCDELDAEVRTREPHILPQSMVACLPNLAPNRDRAIRMGYPEDPVDDEGKIGRRVYPCVGQQDPNIIFSRDCMHQNKGRLRP